MDKVNFKPKADELTFRSVFELRTELYHSLLEDQSGRFGLDLSEITHCDSAGLALLIELRKLCKKYNKVFEIIGMSAETQSLAEFCGVKNILSS